MNTLKLILFSFLTIFIFSCKDRTGDINQLKTPETSIFVSTVNLGGIYSLAGNIKLNWSGQSPNGFIKSYEVAIDYSPCTNDQSKLNALTWAKTSKTDSSFLFNIPKGQIFAKVTFYVRAIDQLDIKDATPACLEIPIKNSIPSVVLDKLYNTQATYDTVHSVFTISWKAQDTDGAANLDSIYLKMNDSKWVALPRNITQVTFVPLNPSAMDSSVCKILLGNEAKLYTKNIGGLKLNNTNIVRIKAKDISNSFSQNDSTKVFYCKRKTSDLLYIDAYSTNEDLTILNPIFIDLFPQGIDKYNLISYKPLLWNITFVEYIKLYKKVYWNNDDSNLLELGAASVESYLSDGGKALISTYTTKNDTTSPIARFAPFQSLTLDKFNGVIIEDYNTLSGFNSNANKKLFSTGGGFVSPKAQFLKAGASNYIQSLDSLKDERGRWIGSNILATSTKAANGKTNQIFFTVPLHRLNGNPTELKNLLNQILNTEFAD